MKNKRLIFTLLILIMAVVGLAVSIKLLYIDYNVAFTANYKPECDINETVSCSSVAESKYAFLLGIPVASYGIFGYLMIILYTFINRKKRDLFNNLFIFFTIFSAVSLYFFLVAKIVLDAVCIYCSTTYIVNWILTIGLLVYVIKNWKTEDKFNPIRSIKTFFDITLKTIPIYGAGFIAIFAISFMMFPHKEAEIFKMAKKESGGVICSNHGFYKMAYGKAQCECEEGFYSKDLKCLDVKHLLKSEYKNGIYDKEKKLAIAGNHNGDVEVILFSDYQCPFCFRLENSLKKILENFSNVKLIRKEYPLDMKCHRMVRKPFHDYACDAAYFAKCAGEQDKFWQACGMLHHHRKKLSPKYLEEYGKMLQLNMKKMDSCIKSEKTKKLVEEDIFKGLKMGVGGGTPTFFINGEKFSGALQYKDLEVLIIEKGGKKNTK